MKLWIKLLLLTSISITGIVGCHDDPDPPPNIPGLIVTPNKDRALIVDSFERDEIFENPDVQTLFGWRGFIWDFGTPVLGLEGDQVEAVIFNNNEVAPASDEEHALYFYGRPGNSVHNLYLISQTYDLSHMNTAILSFDYLTFQLNDAQDLADGVEEYLKVEVCIATVNECGVNADFLDPNGLNSDNWLTIFDHRDASPDLDGLGFDGQNHTVDDWRNGQILVDLNDTNVIVNKASVVFRFTARMRDGLAEDQQCDDQPPHDDDKADELEKYKKKLAKKKRKKKRLKWRIKKLEKKLAKLKKHCGDYSRHPSTGSHYDDKHDDDSSDDVECDEDECEFRIDFLKSKISKKKARLEKLKTKIYEIKDKIAELENYTPPAPPQCEDNNDGTLRFVDGAAIDNINALASPLTIDELF